MECNKHTPVCLITEVILKVINPKNKQTGFLNLRNSVYFLSDLNVVFFADFHKEIIHPMNGIIPIIYIFYERIFIEHIEIFGIIRINLYYFFTYFFYSQSVTIYELVWIEPFCYIFRTSINRDCIVPICI